MAISKIPIPEVYSDLHYEITQDGQGGLKKAINADAIKTSIHNCLNTRKGERVMFPEFGSDIDEQLFNANDKDLMEYLARQARDIVERWDDRAKVTSIDFTATANKNEIDMVVFYRIVGNDQIFQMLISLGG